MSATGETTSFREGVDAPWPIADSAQITLSEEEKRSAEKLASVYLKQEPALSGDWFRKDSVRACWAPGPNVYIEDHRSIALAREEDARSFEYRLLALAGDGDFLIKSEIRDREFERYLRSVVGLSAPQVLSLPQSLVSRTGRLAKAALAHEKTFDKLVHTAKIFGGLNLIPFISTGDVWALGRAIAMRAGQPVRVAGPPPQLSKRSNDKLWFAAITQELLGCRALPKTTDAFSLTQAAYKAKQLACDVDKIIIKVPSSAGALGNILLPTDTLRIQHLSEIRKSIAEKLLAIGWRNQFPLLVGIWDSNVIANPSVQLWVPDKRRGAPIIEGLFAQSVSENRHGFIGAEPAVLERRVAHMLQTEALQIAYSLQQIGYYGRLSLDSILLDCPDRGRTLHWIEANARWGGVSIPMTVARRLGVEVRNGRFLIVQQSADVPVKMSAQQILEKANIKTFSSENKSGPIFLTPPKDGHLIFLVAGIDVGQVKKTANRIVAACFEHD